ncbi:hypothetical protein FRB94_001135 [Tulasnella sp. JGI-2019a]|nr:hypothetical protein FRB94_001135 [Tulasnella sp. JGI-2019a]
MSIITPRPHYPTTHSPTTYDRRFSVRPEDVLAAVTVLQDMVNELHKSLHRWDADAAMLKERCGRLDHDILQTSSRLKEKKWSQNQRKNAVRGETLKEVKKKRERMAIQREWEMDRQQNGETQYTTDPLKPLKVLEDGSVPEGFPATLGDFFKLHPAQTEALLTAYGQPGILADSSLSLRRRRLAQFIGVDKRPWGTSSLPPAAH